MSRIYRYLTAPDTSEFCHKVTKALSQGWVLYGSPSYAADPKSGEMRCAQAVIKDVDDAYDPDRKLGEY